MYRMSPISLNRLGGGSTRAALNPATRARPPVGFRAHVVLLSAPL